MMCRLGLHKYQVRETRTAADGCVRALVRCEKCRKLFHTLSVGKRFIIMPAERAKQFWGLS